jgi:Flp pilus assembly protein TadB
MSGSRRLQWDRPESPPLKHPYRDTLLVYGALAVIVVLIGWATGGPVGRAAVVAIVFFVLASTWSLYRRRSRLREAARRTGNEEHIL